LEVVGIVTLIAVILFARLGMRLLYRYRQLKNEKKDSDSLKNKED